MTWRVHQTRNPKTGAIVEGAFDYCADHRCSHEHFTYTPFTTVAPE
ncbi:hypothetical protein JRC04_04570 [Mycolicibacterium sp. S2-37]|nr:hypothetical protein [Mycolicibacterium sp. S2-37]MBO0676732.1 hypothetical protein [Mycolicibacterium sp. S2-37]